MTLLLLLLLPPSLLLYEPAIVCEKSLDCPTAYTRSGLHKPFSDLGAHITQFRPYVREYAWTHIYRRGLKMFIVYAAFFWTHEYVRSMQFRHYGIN